MKAKIVGFCNRTKQFISAEGGKLMLGALVAAALMDPGTASAVDYDPATLSSGVATLFQSAIAIAGVIAATLIGIRIVKKALRAA